MRVFKLYISIFIASLLFSPGAHSQDKFEKESRVKEKDLPTAALQFLNSLNKTVNINYYKEEGINKISFEAKFKLNKKGYSIEFDTLGKVEDIEIEIGWNDLNIELRDSILAGLKKDCINHKLVKIQEQLSGSEPDLLAVINNQVINQNLITRYELVVRCKAQNSVKLLEYLFDDKGTLVSWSQIIFKNSSHLEY